MFSHARIWGLIDDLAARNGLTASALARRAGLDATAFNKSKRVGRDGRPRWPSTESLAKVLEATETSVEEFLLILAAPERKGTALSLLATAGFAEEDRPPPASGATYLVTVPAPGIPPLYRAGDRLIVETRERVEPGERVAVTTTDGAVRIGEVRSVDGGIRLARPDGSEDTRIEPSAVAEIGRILWVSQ